MILSLKESNASTDETKETVTKPVQSPKKSAGSPRPGLFNGVVSPVASDPRVDLPVKIKLHV